MSILSPTNTTSNPSTFTKLPRELRDKVYREVLVVKTDFKDKSRTSVIFEVHPQILRASKQIHKEAAHVLYEEEQWVMITMNSEHLLAKFREKKYPFVSTKRLDDFGGNPTLHIEVEFPQPRKGSCKTSMLILAAHLYLFCKYFTSDPKIGHASFSLRFDPRLQKAPMVEKSLLEDLCDIRGVKYASVTGLDLRSEDKLVRAMIKPISHVKELIERTKTYTTRAERKLVQFQYSDAQVAYLDIPDFLSWVYDYINDRDLCDSEDNNLETLTSMEYGGYLDFVFCVLKTGDTKRALLHLQRLSVRVDGGNILPQPHKAKASYYTGLVYLSERSENEALRQFLHTLQIEPGHEGADTEIDAMEARIGAMESALVSNVKQNLDFIAGAFRHKTGGNLLSEGELDELLSHFVAEAE